VSEKSRIVLTSRKISSSDNRGEAFKQSTRILLETIERIVETIDMAIGNRVTMRWVHVDLLVELTVKKNILHVKLRDSPAMNRGHCNKSMNGGPMRNRTKVSSWSRPYYC
jgi:hypothetical protein